MTQQDSSPRFATRQPSAAPQPPSAPRILAIDDDRAARELLLRLLEGEQFEVTLAGDGDAGIALLELEHFDLILSDIRMGSTSGYDVLLAARVRCPDTPVILLTAFGDMDGAMEAIRQGAYDYLSKPFQIAQLLQVCRRALDLRRLILENQLLQRAFKEKYQLGSMVGSSPAMLEVYKMVARVAPSAVTIFIQGDSGTGKELVARAIHAESTRATRPFVPLNCGALAEGVLESELFGHERGAFTGAQAARSGLIKEADGGTLFLDEIHAISPKMQTQLLRVLQEGELRRVGASRAERVDVRFVAASNQNLQAMVAEGRFREDLYYRLHVVAIHLPSLRERREDIPLLIEHFLARHERDTGQTVSLTPEALELLMRYDWPGNVRELENTLARAVVLSHQGLIMPSDLPMSLQQAEMPRSEDALIHDRPSLELLSRRYAARIVDEEGGNKSRAAAILGIDRKTLYRLLS